MSALPTTATGVRRSEGNKIAIESAPLPAPEGTAVVVKITAAPINPSDVMWLKGHYPAGKPQTAFAGLEGVGVIAAVGPAADASLVGKRGVFFVGGPTTQGTWADYAVIDAASFIPIPDVIDDEQAACALVNPLTAELFLHTCAENGYTAIVHGAASSALGVMLIAAAKKAGNKVKIINLVRRAENVEKVKAKGGEHIIDIAADGWEAVFAKTVEELKPAAYFDPIAGSAGSKVFSLMPNGATAYCYGALGESPTYDVPVADILFKGKVLRGLWLSTELSKPGLAPKLIGATIANIADKTFQTTIYKKFPVSQYAEALEEYAANASKGKVLLLPGQ